MCVCVWAVYAEKSPLRFFIMSFILWNPSHSHFPWKRWVIREKRAFNLWHPMFEDRYLERHRNCWYRLLCIVSFCWSALWLQTLQILPNKQSMGSKTKRVEEHDSWPDMLFFFCCCFCFSSLIRYRWTVLYVLPSRRQWNKIILHVTLKCPFGFPLATCQCRITYKMPPPKHFNHHEP